MRKVDDEKLLDMLHSGMQQKTIARLFGVSPQYINKRIGQLKSYEASEINEPPTFATLTTAQKKFCISKAQGETNIAAVMQSYEVTSQKSAKSLGTTLMRNPSIQASIAELMDLHGLTKNDRIRQLKKLVYSKDGNVSLKALDQTWKLDGSYAPQDVNMQVDIRAITARADQLLREMKRMDEEEKELQGASLKEDAEVIDAE
jgi:phage terminase small subunit